MEQIRNKLRTLQFQVNEADDRCSTAISNRAAAKERHDQAEMEKESMARRITLLKHQQERRKEQLANTEARLAAMESALAENEAVIADITGRNETVSVDETEDRLRKTRKAATKKQASLDEAKRRVVMLAGKLKTTTERVSAVEEQASTLEAERDRCEEKLTGITNRDIASEQRQEELTQQSEVMAQRLYEAELHLADRKKQYESLKVRNREAEQQIAAVVEERATLEDTLNGMGEQEDFGAEDL